MDIHLTFFCKSNEDLEEKGTSFRENRQSLVFFTAMEKVKLKYVTIVTTVR